MNKHIRTNRKFVFHSTDRTSEKVNSNSNGVGLTGQEQHPLLPFLAMAPKLIVPRTRSHSFSAPEPRRKPAVDRLGQRRAASGAQAGELVLEVEQVERQNNERRRDDELRREVEGEHGEGGLGEPDELLEG